MRTRGRLNAAGDGSTKDDENTVTCIWCVHHQRLCLMCSRMLGMLCGPGHVARYSCVRVAFVSLINILNALKPHPFPLYGVGKHNGGCSRPPILLLLAEVGVSFSTSIQYCVNNNGTGMCSICTHKRDRRNRKMENGMSRIKTRRERLHYRVR